LRLKRLQQVYRLPKGGFFYARNLGAAMDNQHKHIKGYRDLSQAEIDAMNMVKQSAEMVGAVIDAVASIDGVDQQWLAAAKLDLQKGFMCLTRSIAQPTTF
jgi:uncharacterized protein YcbK (DUF882 family)